MMTETQPAVSEPTKNDHDNEMETEQVPLQLCQGTERADVSEPGKAEEASDPVCPVNPPLIARPNDRSKAPVTDEALVEPKPQRFVYWMPEQKGPWNLIHDTQKGREWAVKRGAMFISWAPLSHEPKDGGPEPHRWGDFPFDFDDKNDPDNALKDLNKLIMGICCRYRLDFNAIQYYASGSKGFHAIIPAEVFGAENGDPYLPLIFKRIASTWKAEFELGTLDMSLYNMRKGKLLRVANVQRSNGRYKVPLKPEEVARLSIEDLMELTTAPREIDRPPVELKANEALAKLYRETRVQIHKEQVEGAKCTPLTTEEREKLKEKYGITGGTPLTEEQLATLRDTLPPCIKAILSIKDKPVRSAVNFNRLLLVLVKFFQEAGFGYDDAYATCGDFLERYPSNTYASPGERSREFKIKWLYLDGNDSYHFACSYVRGLKLPRHSFDCRRCPILDDRTDALIRAAVDELNKIHAVIFNGKCNILTEYRNEQTHRPDITISSKRDLKDGYANKKVAIRDEHGRVNLVNPVDLWMASPQRREYKQIVFEPGEGLPNCYNLWRGFAVEPKKGDWSLFQGHIHEVICSGNEEHYRYLLAWMAHTVQEPGGEKPGISVVIRGKQGVGKGCFAHSFGQIFGQHFLQVTNQQHFTGNFNYHLKDCLLLFADEAFWAGSKSEEGSLKSLITEPTLAIEPKGKDVFHVRNHIRLIISSNNSWAIPAGLEERRFFVLDVSDRHQQDHDYFRRLLGQMKNGGTEAMLYDLMNLDISSVNLWKAPRTEALFEQIQHSMDSFTGFWFERLREGTISPDHDTWQCCISKERFYEAYQRYASSMPGKYQYSRERVGIELRKICPRIRETRATAAVAGVKSRPYGYSFPSLEECRSVFEKSCSFDIKWEENEVPRPAGKAGSVITSEPSTNSGAEAENSAGAPVQTQPVTGEEAQSIEALQESGLPPCFGQFDPKSEKCLSECTNEECEDYFMDQRRAGKEEPSRADATLS
jgi:hypothetical protein